MQPYLQFSIKFTITNIMYYVSYGGKLYLHLQNINKFNSIQLYLQNIYVNHNNYIIEHTINNIK
jgi:hypothetical protein